MGGGEGAWPQLHVCGRGTHQGSLMEPQAREPSKETRQDVGGRTRTAHAGTPYCRTNDGAATEDVRGGRGVAWSRKATFRLDSVGLESSGALFLARVRSAV